tara:strand:- start:59590 stop:60591 length:1002 start_codon:yes stop_codon:yes gene_type:complete
MDKSKKYKALICITTCNRLNEVKKFALEYIRFSNDHENFDFLLSLDGKDDEYIDFCSAYSIPLLYSEQREGVGLSKNRVLSAFSQYDYYFFIEDDVELLDPSIFSLHIKAALLSNYHHFTVSAISMPLEKEKISNAITIIHADHGGGTFNFFTSEGLEKVGGWHEDFASLKRYGHVEHTLRFVNAGLSPSPFLFIEEAQNMILVHDPEHVSSPVKKYKDTIFSELEYNIVKKKLDFYPIKTLSNYHFNQKDMNYVSGLKKVLSKKLEYPLLNFFERRKALSEKYLVYSGKDIPIRLKRLYILKFILNNPLGKKTRSFFKQRITVYLNRIFSKK